LRKRSSYTRRWQPTHGAAPSSRFIELSGKIAALGSECVERGECGRNFAVKMRYPWRATPQGIVRYGATFAQFSSHSHDEDVNVKWSAIKPFITSRLDLLRYLRRKHRCSLFQLVGDEVGVANNTLKGFRAGRRDYRAKGMTAL
jgi:hypothetical protein